VTRLHIVSLPHTLLTRDYDWCAYTAKCRRFVDMLAAGPHQAIVYGPDIHDDCTTASEYVPIVDGQDRTQWFGASEWDVNEVFNHWDLDHPSWRIMNERAATQIRARWQPGDMIGIIGGRCQEAIVSALADLKPLVVEWGIGYSGTLNGSHKVFESYAWMHHVAGFYHRDDIAFFDTVIPNCFDPDDFIYSKQPGDYLLFIGRPNPRKGLAILEDVAKRIDMPVLVAGQPGPPIPNTEYVGVVLGEQKAQLIAGARALIAPTTYLEPFGGVTVEAMMSGTPVITTDWGAFTETVVDEITGFRCRMLRQFLEAVDRAGDLDRGVIHDYAVANFSTSTGARLYSEYLFRLESLFEDGWYQGTTANS
jgi:glycosyltransferase involved in cell wall biosynthesis